MTLLAPSQEQYLGSPTNKMQSPITVSHNEPVWLGRRRGSIARSLQVQDINRSTPETGKARLRDPSLPVNLASLRHCSGHLPSRSRHIFRATISIAGKRGVTLIVALVVALHCTDSLAACDQPQLPTNIRLLSKGLEAGSHSIYVACACQQVSLRLTSLHKELRSSIVHHVRLPRHPRPSLRKRKTDLGQITPHSRQTLVAEARQEHLRQIRRCPPTLRSGHRASPPH